MTRQDFRLLISPVSLAAPMEPARPKAKPKKVAHIPMRGPARRRG